MEPSLKFARRTPPAVADWLHNQLVKKSDARLTKPDPHVRVLYALATDARMSDLWRRLGEWRGGLRLIAAAVDLSAPWVLSELRKAPEKRSLGPEEQLGIAAKYFAKILTQWPDVAAELWGEPLAPLIDRLRLFTTAAEERAKLLSIFTYIPAVPRSGRGCPEQLAFRTALSCFLRKLKESAPLSKGLEDHCIATITSVVFPDHPVDTDTIRRHRQRQSPETIRA